MHTLKSIIVEDEKSSQITLQNMLLNFCKGVEVVGISGTVDEAIKLIQKEKPDLVFLDIELPEKNGFHLLEYFPEATFEIIFTTAYNQYAVKAFRMSAIDYLLKPIDLDELRLAIEKVAEKKTFSSNKIKYQLLQDNMNNVFNKLALPGRNGSIFVEIADIVRIEADGNYTIFYLKSGTSHVVSKTLRVYDELLSDFNFFRINRKDILNLNHIVELRRHKKMTILASDGRWLTVTESRKEDFLSILNPPQ
jgi:two-component system LytT family response regulator